MFKDTQEWIMDTGSGVDLVTRSAVTHASKHFEKATFTMEFNTANGKTTAHEVVKATMPPLSECIGPMFSNRRRQYCR